MARAWLGDRLQAVAGAVALPVEDFEGDRLERQQNPPARHWRWLWWGLGWG